MHPCLRRPQKRCQRERVTKGKKRNERERGREREQADGRYGSRDVSRIDVCTTHWCQRRMYKLNDTYESRDKRYHA